MDLGDVAAWFEQQQLGKPNVLHLAVGCLEGHRLVWNYRSPRRGAGAANVEPAVQRSVPGLLLEVDDATLSGLDRKEGHPGRYLRQLQTCRVWSGELREAWVYRVVPAYRERALVPPRAGYRDILLAAARRHGFPAEYIAELEALQVIED